MIAPGARRASAWWLTVVIAGAASAYAPRVGAVLLAGVIAAATWRWPDRVQAGTVWLLLVVRPSLDIFSQRWLALEQFALSPAVAFGLLVLLVTTVIAVRRGATGHALWPDSELWHAHAWLFGALAVATGSGLWWYGGVGASNGLRELARAVSAIAAMLLVLWWAAQDARRYRRGWILLTIGLIGPLVVAAWQWLAGTGNLDTEGLNRLQGTFSHPNTLGPFLVPFILVALAAAQRWHRVAQVLLLAASAGLTVVVALTYSRTGILVLLAALVCLPFLQVRQAGWGALMRAVAIVLLFSVVGWLVAGDSIRERFADVQLDAVAFRVFDPGTEENSLQWRLINWAILIGVASNHWMSGHGLALTTVVNPMTDYRTGVPINAHNDFVRFLVEGGVIGVLCYLAYGVLLCRWAIRQARTVAPSHAATALAPAATLVAMVLLTGGAAEFSSQTAIQYELGAMLGLVAALRLANSRDATLAAPRP